MSWRSLSRTQKLFVAVGGACGVGLFVNYSLLPKYSDQIKTLSYHAEADGYTAKRCDDGYDKLQASASCTSLLKKYLTRTVLDELKLRKTLQGGTLWDVIASGVANLDADVGVYATDAAAYHLFAKLFDPIIEHYHEGFGPNDKQPPVDLGEDKAKSLEPLDKDGKYIISTRIRCGRSLKGYPFNPLLTNDDYLIMEKKVRDALQSVTDPELQGTYYPLSGMTKDVQNQLVKEHFLFKEGDRHLQAANACRFWPAGRGIYHNKDKTFLVWLNEEDHMRIISMQKGGDVGAVLDRLVRAVKAIESRVPFARDERLGWLTFCPTNLGSTVRASVHVKLPKVSKRKDFKEICDKLNLQIRGLHGEHSESVGGVYDISNKRRLGVSEWQAVSEMYDGVKTLIDMEKGGG